MYYLIKNLKCSKENKKEMWCTNHNHVYTSHMNEAKIFGEEYKREHEVIANKEGIEFIPITEEFIEHEKLKSKEALAKLNKILEDERKNYERKIISIYNEIDKITLDKISLVAAEEL